MQISLLIQTRPLFHWRNHYYGLWTLISARSNSLNLKKKVLMMDLFQLLSSPDVNWWTGVVWITCGLLWCFYQLFGLSFWRHPFTAEDPLLRQWLNATFLQIWWRKTHSHLGWSESEHIFIFGWTVPLTQSVNRATTCDMNTWTCAAHMCVCVCVCVCVRAAIHWDDWQAENKKVKGYADSDVAIALM